MCNCNAGVIYKFNSGEGAAICSKCRTIIREGKGLTEDDINEMHNARKTGANILRKPLDCIGVDFKRQKGKTDEAL